MQAWQWGIEMALTPAGFKALLGEFAGIDDTTVQQYLDQAGRLLKVDAWGARYDDGQLYLTAHLITCFASGAAEGGASGPVSAKRVGEVSASYAVSDAFKASAMGSTKYGRMFLELQQYVMPQVCRCL